MYPNIFSEIREFFSIFKKKRTGSFVRSASFSGLARYKAHSHASGEIDLICGGFFCALMGVLCN